jgi:predicted amidohydrolase YtcJ
MAARLTAYLVVAIVAATLIAGLIVGAQRDDSEGPVDLIVRNATVYTADRRGTMAEAVAVRGNQILRVGSDREIARLQRPQTIVVDAGGGAVLPGFNDARVDLIEGGLALEAIDLTGAASTADLLERISAWSAAHPTRPWIVGRGWPVEHFRNGLPSRQLLDSVVPDRPALMIGADGRSVWVNTKALRAARITRQTPDPADGAIVREPRTKEPAGVLQGTARDLISGVVPRPSQEERESALRRAIVAANQLGITSVQNPFDAIDDFDLYDGLRRSHDLTLRVYSGLPLTHVPTDADLARYAAMRERYPDDPRFKTGALAIRLDGPVATRDAALLEPYVGAADTDNETGSASFTPDDLNKTARLADAAGWQLVTSATGDRAVRMALNAYAHAARSNRAPARGRRHRIDGLTLVDPIDLPRFGPLDVVASMQPIGSAPAPDRVKAIVDSLGEERTGRTFAFRDTAAQTRLLLASGWPAGDLSPLAGIHVAVNQATFDHVPESGWHAAQRLELKKAIDAYTSTPAWASFDDQRKGTISAGMLADLVVLTDDIFEIPSARLGSVAVATTIFNGKIIYSRVPRADMTPADSLQH